MQRRLDVVRVEHRDLDAAINALGEQLWAAGEDYLLLSIPLYILLGEILVRGGATDKMYQSLADWLNFLPGGLLHTNIGASALFSAVSGSSVATAATISTVALPAFKTRKYDQRMVLGSIAAGASLGNLIPPGIAFLVYGAMTNTSAGRLYAAGVVLYGPREIAWLTDWIERQRASRR